MAPGDVLCNANWVGAAPGDNFDAGDSTKGVCSTTLGGGLSAWNEAYGSRRAQ